MSMYKKNRSLDDESGMVSIVVTMIIMVLLSLVVLGFAKVSRREQRQGLDRQLAAQAKYAAETGINDAQDYIRSGNPVSATADSVCNSYAGVTLPRPAAITDQISTACVLVSDSAPELVYDNIGTDSEVVVPVRSANGSNIQSITISWQNNATAGSAGSYTSALCPDRGPSIALVPMAEWKCPSGALRVDVVPVGGGVTRTDLINQSVGVLLYPKVLGHLGASIGETPKNGSQIWGECSNNGSPLACQVSLYNLGGSSAYYLRIRPVYKEASIYISARNSATGSGSVIGLKGAQVTIDSTGRATDILKRLVARVPACPKTQQCGKQPAGFALQTADSICKLYTVIPPSSVTTAGSDPSCSLP